MHISKLLTAFPAVLTTCVSVTGEVWGATSAAPDAVAALPPAGKHTFISTPAVAFNEQPGETSVGWHGGRTWRKEGSRLQITLAAVGTLIAMMAVTYLVMQCFKAIGKSSSEAHHSRGLSDNQASHERADSCTNEEEENGGNQEDGQQPDQGHNGGPRPLGRVLTISLGILSLITRGLANSSNNNSTDNSTINGSGGGGFGGPEFFLPLAGGALVAAVVAGVVLQRRQRQRERRERERQARNQPLMPIPQNPGPIPNPGYPQPGVYPQNPGYNEPFINPRYVPSYREEREK